MAKKKRLDASTLDQVVDATTTLTVIVQRRHCVIGKPQKAEECALVVAAKEQHGFSEFSVHRNVAFAQREGELHKVRYQSSASTRRFFEAFDVGDYTGITNGGIEFTFRPPKASITLHKLRSEEHKKMRRLSDKRRRNQPHRPYRLPDPKTLAGVRSRFGFRSDD